MQSVISYLHSTNRINNLLQKGLTPYRKSPIFSLSIAVGSEICKENTSMICGEIDAGGLNININLLGGEFNQFLRMSILKNLAMSICSFLICKKSAFTLNSSYYILTDHLLINY